MRRHQNISFLHFTLRKKHSLLCGFCAAKGHQSVTVKQYYSVSGAVWMIWRCAHWKILSGYVRMFEGDFCFVSCHCYFWPKWAGKRFRAVTCAHSYSFVSIETPRAGQPCILELHKALPIIRHTIWCGISHLNGFLF